MMTAGHPRVHTTFVVLALAVTSSVTVATVRREPGIPRAYGSLDEAMAAARYANAAGAPRGGAALQDETMFQEAYLKASNTQSADHFGQSVAISGDTAVVGAHFESSNATGIDGDQSNNLSGQAGAAYVFVRTAAGWQQQAYLKASNTGLADHFGFAVAIDGDTIVVGAPDASIPGSLTATGIAYVFVRGGSTWTEQYMLFPSNPGLGDAFGTSVAISGDTIVVGAQKEDSAATGVNGNQGDNAAVESGAAYVFARNDATWTQEAYLKASNTDPNDLFGFSVAISGNRIIVGSPQEDGNATGVNGDDTNDAGLAGAAYVFERTYVIGGDADLIADWNQTAYVKASNTRAGDAFGYSVAISGDTAVVGARLEASAGIGVNGSQTNNVLSTAGAAYVFDRDHAGNWSQHSYLKATNTDSFDQFGYSVAISGDVIIVGAYLEDSNAVGINGDGTNDLATNTGAAYVYVRVDGAWQAHAYLKASNPNAFDNFGSSVAASLDTVIVGALNESGNATGVDGDQADNSALQSGAAYVLRLLNTDPTITAGSVTRWPDTSANFAVASVNDAQDGPGSLNVNVQSANPSNGVTLANLFNTAGTITADVIVASGASNASFLLRVTDSFGASSTATFNVDVVAAVSITPTVDPPANANGWHNGQVTVSWTVNNGTPESGCDPIVVSAETTTSGATLTCTAGNAGGSTSQSATVKIDLTPPLGTASRTPAPSTNGWNNTDVTVTFTCGDALSGAESTGSSETITTEGAGQSRVFACMDLAGNSAPLSITNVNIDKTVPSVVATSVIASPNPVMVNTAVALSASLTDLGFSNLARAEYRIGTGAYAQLTAASTTAATVSGSIGSFAEPNVLETCVRAVDLADNASPEECILVAVFDPTAGYVTGAGTIDSPAGALVGSTATGPARFGFQSKYARGATIPSGNTQFRFRAGDLDFDSSAYQWLVVSGARAQYKGTGTIRNQDGTFDFLLTVIDGDQAGGGGVDKFRIKITGAAGVVYDNQMGASDNADPTTAISGGHIVIRK